MTNKWQCCCKINSKKKDLQIRLRYTAMGMQIPNRHGYPMGSMTLCQCVRPVVN